MNPPDIDIIEPDFEGAGLRVGIVRARFNEFFTEALQSACITELLRLGVVVDDITVATVPGALELPLALRQMGASQQYDALVAIGCVLRGETYHFEVVSNESARGIGEVALHYDLPIANAVLTVETEEQAAARTTEKGTEAARVAVEMANLALSLSDIDAEDEEEGEDKA
jgi:6,7-dimethyl-8-ribityllumazine synthase